MKSYVLGFQELDKDKLMIVGGKGANLGELSKIDGIQVPEGFCITTEAYKRIVDTNEGLNVLLDQLSFLKLEDRGKIAEISGKIRRIIEEISIPKDMAEAIIGYLSKIGENHAYAVRSSATAEDLPTASFAGQQDTYLNIIGKDAILQHVSKCWGSLFTERPITTLYPIPEVKDGKNHVYISYGHRQMMTDAMKPLGLTFFQMFFRRFGGAVVEEAGGRMFMDVSHELRSTIKAKILLGSIAKVDILMENALRNVMKRKDFMKTLPSGKSMMSAGSGIGRGLKDGIKFYRRNDPSIVTNLIAKSEERLHKREDMMSYLTGNDLFDFIDKDMDEFKKAVTDGYGAYFVAMYASDWISKRMEKWLGEKNVADTLSQSVQNNVTSEMGLELLDVADVVRQYPEVIEYFTHANDETFFTDLPKVKGGKEVRKAMESYLKKYGMRCTGETDISRPRWNEKPTTLIAAIMGYVNNFQPGEHKRKFEKDLAEAQELAENLLSRLGNLLGGKKKAQKTEKMISVLRNFAGYREYNKYMLVWYFWIIKQSFLREADKLVEQGIIKDREDIYFLTYEEFKKTV